MGSLTGGPRIYSTLWGRRRRRLLPCGGFRRMSAQFAAINRAVAHSSATLRKFSTLAFPTTYGFGVIGPLVSIGRLILDRYQSVWLERITSAPACRAISRNRSADRM